MAIQDDNTLLSKGDLKEYHQKILPYLGGNLMISTNVSDYYSTDEKIVGVWTDGKPIYQKTFPFTASGDGSLVSDLSTLDMELLIDMYGVAYEGNTGYSFPNSYTNPRFDPNTKTIKLQVQASTWNFTAGSHITVRYTKTTDSANSAATTVGCYDINRPDQWLENTEIYFGNGLYGYRATGTITATSGARQYTSLYKTNATYLVSSGGMWNCGNSENDYYAVGGNDEYNTPISSAVRLRNNNGAGDIALLSSSAQNRTNAPYDIWVTYTK